MAISDIFNFVQIDDDSAAGGQPSEAQFRAVREAGYEAVINLAPDGLDTSLPGEAALIKELGLEYHHIPVAWTAPGLDELDEFIALMDRLDGRRKLIHCQANFRVTVFYALYAMARLGWSRKQADALIDRIWTSRPDFRMDDTWSGFVAAARQRLPGG